MVQVISRRLQYYLEQNVLITSFTMKILLLQIDTSFFKGLGKPDGKLLFVPKIGRSRSIIIIMSFPIFCYSTKIGNFTFQSGAGPIQSNLLSYVTVARPSGSIPTKKKLRRHDSSNSGNDTCQS